MRKLFVVSLILAALVMSLLVLTGPGTAQASPASPNRLLASTPTPKSPTTNKLPPSGVLPATGDDRSDYSAVLLIGVGGILLTAGLVIRRRRWHPIA